MLNKLSQTRPGQEQARADILGQVRSDQVRSGAELGRVRSYQAKSGACQEGQGSPGSRLCQATSGQFRSDQLKVGKDQTATQSQQLAPDTRDYSVDPRFCRRASGAGLQSSS